MDNHDRCTICKQLKAIVNDGMCEACLLGSQHTFTYECQQKGCKQRIPHPMWRYQLTRKMFGSVSWYCQHCKALTYWKIESEDVAKIPPELCPESWLPGPVVLDEIPIEFSGIPPSKISPDDFPHQPAHLWYGKISPHVNIPRGRGTIIAFIDSGINTAHISLRGKVLIDDSRSFVPGEISDVHGHGTRCAGIACGAPTPIPNDSGEIMWPGGIATEARILACKVVPDCEESVNTAALCRALEYVLQYKIQNPRKDIVVSIQFSMKFCDNDICSRITALLNNNIIVLCVASNREKISYPARMGGLLCIGAADENGEVAYFSACGREINFLAPGVKIWAPDCRGDSFVSVEGTSYATAAVAGLVCQIIEDIRLLTPHYIEAGLHTADDADALCSQNVIREILETMATHPSSHDQQKGSGVLNPSKFFNKTLQEKIHLFELVLGLDDSPSFHL